MLSYSSKSGNGLISINWSVGAILVVHAFPLEVIVVLNICGSMNNWVPHIHEEENWHDWIGYSDPVSWQTNIQNTISLIRDPWLHKSSIVWLGRKCNLLLSEAWNLHINCNLQLWVYLVLLNHVHNLLLFIINMRKWWSDLWQVLINIVLHFILDYIII